MKTRAFQAYQAQRVAQTFLCHDRACAARGRGGRAMNTLVTGITGRIGANVELGGPAPFTWEEVIPYRSERLGIPYLDARSSAVPTYYEYDLSKTTRRIDFQPQYDIFRMIDDALAFSRGKDIGVLPTA